LRIDDASLSATIDPCAIGLARCRTGGASGCPFVRTAISAELKERVPLTQENGKTDMDHPLDILVQGFLGDSVRHGGPGRNTIVRPRGGNRVALTKPVEDGRLAIVEKF
jgi:hypothetical protein